MRRIRRHLLNPFRFLWAIIGIATRRLRTNGRLTLGLAVGFSIAVAASTSVPLFTAASLQRVLQGELTKAQVRLPASIHLAHFENPRRPTTIRQFMLADEIARQDGLALLNLPIQPFVRFGMSELGLVRPYDPARVNPTSERWMAIAFQSDLSSRIRLMDGREPRATRTEDGSFEALVEEAVLDKQDLTVGAELLVPLGNTDGAPLVRVTIVGAFERADPTDPYWFQGNPYERHFFVPEETFRSEIMVVEGAVPFQYSWYYGIESGDVRITDALRLLGAMYELEARMAQVLSDTELFNGPMKMLTQYAYRASDLQMLLLLLIVPLLVVVAYFIVVTAGMMVDRQRQEIALLRSRGASVTQILFIYLVEGLLLAVLALVAGYPMGMSLARLMGSTVGFLEFVNRQQPELLMGAEFWLFGLLIAGLAIIAYVAPALPAARNTIVSYKHESARSRGRPLWARLGLDFICLGLGAYAYYSISGRAHVNQASVITDPFQILAPAVFVVGAGLLVIRCIPLVSRWLARLANRWAGAPTYLALVHLARAPSSNTPVVFLLTLTVGMGLYSATAARTVEQNTIDRLLYSTGANVILDEVWEFSEAEDSNPTRGQLQGEFIPPPWEVHYELPGVSYPARVRRQDVTPTVGGRAQRKATLMAVDPQDFGRVAWFRRDLAPFHFYDYLNQLMKDEEAVLVSQEFVQRNHLRLGDRVTLTGIDGHEVSLVIYGWLEHWPTLYEQTGDFFIANLDYVETHLGLRPYQVWLNMEPGARLQPVIDALKANSILTINAVDSRQELLLTRRDPMLNGLMGSLTTSFLLSLMLTVLGFWLHAALSAQARQLQFGLMRAMGLSGGQLTWSVVLEQVLSAGVGVAAGTGAGLVAAQLFVPFLQQGAEVVAQTPPFRVITVVHDQVRLYALLFVMLVISVVGLRLFLRQLRVYEAVKLGEDH